MLKKSTQYWLRVVLIVLAVIFLWAIIPVLWPLIVSLICTLILLPVVNNIQDYMRHRLGFTWFPRWLAIIPAFLLVALILLLVIQFIILPFIAEFTRLLNNLPVLMSQLILLWQDITSGEWLKLPPQIDAIVMTTLARISSYGVELAQRGIFAIFSLATTMLECLLVPIMTFYLLKDGRQIKSKVISIFQPPYNRYLMDVVNQMHRTMGRSLFFSITLPFGIGAFRGHSGMDSDYRPDCSGDTGCYIGLFGGARLGSENYHYLCHYSVN